jgi:hypothetical protein
VQRSRFRPGMAGASARLTQGSDNLSPDSSSRIPASLASPSIRSFGHLRVSAGRSSQLDPLRSGPGRRQSNPGSRRIGRCQLNKGRGRRNFRPPTPTGGRVARVRLLPWRDQPVALDRHRIRQRAVLVDVNCSTIRIGSVE